VSERLNLVECFFSITTRQAIRRGSYTSVRELTAVTGAFSEVQRTKARTSALTHH
jgi:hypothetical protein